MSKNLEKLGKPILYNKRAHEFETELRNKAEDGLYKVCEDCGEVLQENYVQHQSYFETPPIRKTIGKNEVRLKNYMYFRSGLNNKSFADIEKIGKRYDVKYIRNKRKEEIVKEIEDNRSGKTRSKKDALEKMKLEELKEVAKKHGVKNLTNKKKEDIVKEIKKIHSKK